MKEENVQIPLKNSNRRPSDWFRDSFGTLGKYGKISKEQFRRASSDVEVIIKLVI